MASRAWRLSATGKWATAAAAIKAEAHPALGPECEAMASRTRRFSQCCSASAPWYACTVASRLSRVAPADTARRCSNETGQKRQSARSCGVFRHVDGAVRRHFPAYQPCAAEDAARKQTNGDRLLHDGIREKTCERSL